jgi:hypothetical protein
MALAVDGLGAEFHLCLILLTLLAQPWCVDIRNDSSFEELVTAL